MSLLVVKGIRGRLSAPFSIKLLFPSTETSSRRELHGKEQRFKLVVAGGGAGGLSIGSKFARTLPKGSVAIIEPSESHYYQALWSLVGAGIKKFADSKRLTKDLMPSKATWIQDRVAQFSPEANSISLGDGSQITYDYLVIAVGIQLDFGKIKGLEDALKTDFVGSNYSAETVNKTWEALRTFKGGNALFTFPNSPVKCAGAPQKIMYLAEEYFAKAGIRDKSNVLFYSALPVIFSVAKYANVLNQIIKKRNMITNFRHNLIEVKSKSKEAVFENLDTNKQYDMLHVTPPQSAPKVLAPLADATGFVNVSKETLQHVKYKNVFAIGDCTNLPTSKTAAAVAGQNGVLFKNLTAVMGSKPTFAQYNGYTSCPLVTSSKTCVLAEFDYNLQPHETFFFDQGKERYSMYFLKKNVMPAIYWNLMLKGRWDGPGVMKNLMGPLSSKKQS